MNRFIVGVRFMKLLLPTFILTGLWALYLAFLYGFLPTALEEGPLERMQEAILVFAALLFAAAAFFQRDAGRMASVGVSILCVVFFLRELELPVTGPVTEYLNSDLFRLHEALVVLAVALPYIVLRWQLMPQFLDYLRKFQAWPFLLAAAFLFAGEIAEKFAPTMARPELGMFFEELLETFGYLVLVCLAAHVVCAVFAASESEKAVSR
ncbi:hypothetical protein FPY71_15625 [Aureimonas fodinaquatilis]|uniref:Uncharacterized protein n=1 Tax=Aureimonas fodinaquatilis TaxID=2565783 RepID=A0A5B0DRI5_9HYPH|nr:hypothetical protein [Aureimonas fodinaquatilis]KAA0968983.1 hypothetical protein FPY71_15625 [Aureimonas fodinaquatilis]